MIPHVKSNHEIIADFWDHTSALLFVIAIACAYGKCIMLFLAALSLSIIAGYRAWIARNNDKDEPAPLKKHLEYYACIWFAGVIGFIFIFIAYPVTIYKYIKARRSPYN